MQNENGAVPFINIHISTKFPLSSGHDSTFLGLCVQALAVLCPVEPDTVNQSSSSEDNVTQCFSKLTKSLKQHLSDQLYTVADPVFI